MSFPDVTTIEMIEANPFRLLAIGAEASLKEAERQASKMNILAQATGNPYEGLSPLLPSPTGADDYALREAVQALNDPYQRLCAEIFWFRYDAQSAKGAGLECLRKGDFAAAEREWKSAAKGGAEEVATGALHSLAILHLVLALQESRRAQNHAASDATLNAAILERWKAADACWKELLQKKSFWNHMRQRIFTIDDKRLKISEAESLRPLSSEAIAHLHVALASEDIVAGRLRMASQHLELALASSSGKGAALCGAALRPVKQRIKESAERAERELSAEDCDPADIYKAFMASVRPAIDTLRVLDPRGEFASATAQNEAAEALRMLGQKLANPHSQYTLALQALEEAKRCSASEALNAQIGAIVKTCKSEMEDGWEGVDTRKCWFCKTRLADKGRAVTVTMYKVTDRTYNAVHYSTRKFDVPRCESCAKVHFTQTALLVAAVAGCLLFSFLGAVAGAALWAALCVGTGAYWRYGKSGIRGTRYHVKYPHYLKSKREGFLLGEKPPSQG